MSRMKIGCILAMVILVFAGGIAYAVSNNQDKVKSETETKVIVPQSAPVLPPTSPVPTSVPTPTPPPPTPPPPTPPSLSSMPPEFFLDSDGDGFNDWFEANIAKTDPFIPNNRYIVLFLGEPKEPAEFPLRDNKIKEAEFFKQEGVPSENIFLLLYEDSTGPNLRKTIEKIAEKSTDNDIVFISLHAHSTPGGVKEIPYASINDWLNKVKAKVVIVHIIACGSESALPVLKDGPYPRIVFIWYGEFFSALGIGPVGKYSVEVDTKYGNSDGYVSLKEISSWHENDWKFVSPMALETGVGIPTMLDSSNISSKIYLTDYTP